jgi:hypothetical protein
VQGDKLARGEGVVASSSGQTWRLNPLKTDSKVGVQEAVANPRWYRKPLDYVRGSGPARDADTPRLGRGVDASSPAGFAQTAGALDARALGDAGLQQARTAAIGAELPGAGLRGVARVRQAVLPGSRAEVQRAIDLENNAGRGYDALRLGQRLLKGSQVPAMVGMGLAGGATATLSGQSGRMYHQYQVASGVADEQQAEYERQVAVERKHAAEAARYANGRGVDTSGAGVAPGNGGTTAPPEPQIDPATGLTIDPRTGLEYDAERGIAYDPTTGTTYDLATGRVVSSTQPTPTPGIDAGAATGDGTSTVPAASTAPPASAIAPTTPTTPTGGYPATSYPTTTYPPTTAPATAAPATGGVAYPAEEVE